MQAFDDLKQDIQTLIDTATSTIQQLVDQAARNAAAAVPVTSGAETADVFTSQMLDLSSKVKAATENLRQQAAAVLSGGGSTGGTDTSGSIAEPEDPGVDQGVPRAVGPDSFKSAN